jgi:hypothetical protein
MRDLFGFALLVVVTILILFLTYQFILPFLVKYLFGILSFFILATFIVHKGRIHTMHFEGYFKPRAVLMLAFSAFALPLLHAFIVFLYTDFSFALVLFVLNALFPVIWTAKVLFAHRRQRKRYFSEGHDLEDLIERWERWSVALQLEHDTLSSLQIPYEDCEPWERKLGLGPLFSKDITKEKEEMMDAIKGLGKRIDDLIARAREALALVQSKQGKASASDFASEEKELEQGCDMLLSRSKSLLDEVYSGIRAPEWEDMVLLRRGVR